MTGEHPLLPFLFRRVRETYLASGEACTPESRGVFQFIANVRQGVQRSTRADSKPSRDHLRCISRGRGSASNPAQTPGPGSALYRVVFHVRSGQRSPGDGREHAWTPKKESQDEEGNVTVQTDRRLRPPDALASPRRMALRNYVADGNERRWPPR